MSSAGGLMRAGEPICLLQWQLDSFVDACSKMVFVDHARASVPAQQGIVVSGGAKRFRFFKPIHRFTESFVGMMTAAGRPARELSFGQTLRQNPPVIGVLVFASNSR